jgi:hypothetical protein
MTIHFVSFATPAFRPRQVLLELSAKTTGKADEIHTWNPARLTADGFTLRHADLFPGSKGFGWYSWKPHIIHQAMLSADDGDLIVYQDVGRREPILITHPLSFWNNFFDQSGQDCVPGVAIPRWGPNRLWTKKRAFDALGLNAPAHLEKPQIQASWSVWRKSPATLSFVAEWADLSTRRDLIGGDLPDGQEGECPGFVEHRWDQSLLTLLTWRGNLHPLTELAQPPAGFNEKCCASWVEHLDGGTKKSFVSTLLCLAANGYVHLESGAKVLFKRNEFLPNQANTSSSFPSDVISSNDPINKIHASKQGHRNSRN